MLWFPPQFFQLAGMAGKGKRFSDDNLFQCGLGEKATKEKQEYINRDSLEGFRVVARIFFLPCLGPA